jgi:tetratricopeptide (TPR) repeat protein
MNNKISVSLILLSLTAFSNLFSQTYNKPNFALKSHETLELLKVEITSEKTILYLSIENRIERGTFCADRNIYLLDPEGKKFELKKSSGIPTCPDSYKFKSIGEKLQFTLEFPPLKPGTKWIDIIEDCNNNCFSFYGVILDNDLNKKLDEGFALAEKGESSKAIIIFKEILSNTYDRVNGVAGALYTEIITLEYKAGNITSASEWYKRMLASNSPRLELYIKNLNSRGVKF